MVLSTEPQIAPLCKNTNIIDSRYLPHAVIETDRLEVGVETNQTKVEITRHLLAYQGHVEVWFVRHGALDIHGGFANVLLRSTVVEGFKLAGVEAADLGPRSHVRGRDADLVITPWSPFADFLDVAA